MEELAEDDIDILNHERAGTHQRQDGQFPIPMSSEESVASHFALVTAYEDIKKRLKETERENSFLKKRVRLLEEKLLESHLEEATSSLGREQVNKAYQAYRESCIERDNLKSQLDKTMKENMEYVKILNEQLQSKEVELLQLRTEVETQQVMKSFNSNPSNWEIDKLNSELKLHNLELDLEKLREECNHLRKELQKSLPDGDTGCPEAEAAEGKHPAWPSSSQALERIQQVYRELKREMSNLHLVTKVQAEMLKKLKLIPSTTKKVPSYTSVQCIEDLERDATNLHLVASGAICRNRLLQTSGDVFGNLASSSPCTNEKFSSACDSPFLEHNSCGKNSLEDNSWVFPNLPKPSETVFWEMKNRVTHLNFPGSNLDQYNQNCLYKS
uniref:5-azacytidine-induced protein 2 n=1 Tax=Laticauda laticaudata TaxID=8630 RepID=A0A8C5S1N6_LATLA